MTDWVRSMDRPLLNTHAYLASGARGGWDEEDDAEQED
jgi:hypothetical protein